MQNTEIKHLNSDAARKNKNKLKKPLKALKSTCKVLPK